MENRMHSSPGRNYFRDAVRQSRRRASSSAANLGGQGTGQRDGASAKGIGGNPVIGRPVAMQNSRSSLLHMSEASPSAVPGNWSSSCKRKAPASGMSSHDFGASPYGASGSLTMPSIPWTSQRTYEQLNSASDSDLARQVGMSSQYSAGGSYGASGSSSMLPMPLAPSSTGIQDQILQDSTTVDPLRNGVPEFDDKHGDTSVDNSFTSEEVEFLLKLIESPSGGLPDQTVPHSLTNRVPQLPSEELEALVQQKENTSNGLGNQTAQESRQRNKDVAVANTSYSDLEPCPLCRVEYARGDDIMILKCRHDFHADCIKQWLVTRTSKCPVCLTPAFTT